MDLAKLFMAARSRRAPCGYSEAPTCDQVASKEVPYVRIVHWLWLEPQRTFIIVLVRHMLSFFNKVTLIKNSRLYLCLVCSYMNKWVVLHSFFFFWRKYCTGFTICYSNTEVIKSWHLPDQYCTTTSSGSLRANIQSRGNLNQFCAELVCICAER